jgi:hypothetical protein
VLVCVLFCNIDFFRLVARQGGERRGKENNNVVYVYARFYLYTYINTLPCTLVVVVPKNLLTPCCNRNERNGVSFGNAHSTENYFPSPFIPLTIGTIKKVPLNIFLPNITSIIISCTHRAKQQQ